MGQNSSLLNQGQPLAQAILGEGRLDSPSPPHHQQANGGLTSNNLLLPHHTSSTRPKQPAPKPPTNNHNHLPKKKKVVAVRKKSGVVRKTSSSSAGLGGGAKFTGNGRGVINRRSFRSASNGKPNLNHIRTSHSDYKHISEVHKGGSAQPSDGSLPSTELRRQRRYSATTNSSVGTNGHVPPVITVTDHSEAESTDIDFDPSNFNNKSEDDNRTSTPKARPQDMDVSVSRYVSETVLQQPRRQSPLGSSGKERRTSGTSNVSTESESNKNRYIAKRHSAEIRLKKGLLSKNDPRTDTANKWGNIVSEFQEVYVDDSKLKAEEKVKKEPRKVNKLTNLEQYENVRQVFNRSMPLPMQMAPPGAKVEDIEAETASETSTYSWNLMTPMAKSSRHQSSSQEHISSGRTQLGIQSHHEGQQGGISSNMHKSGGLTRTHHGSMGALNTRDARTSREFSRSEGAAAASRSRSASRSGSRSQSAQGYRSRSQERQLERTAGKQKQRTQSGGRQGNVTEESIVKETRQVVQSKGGAGGGGGAGRGGAKMVKYQSKGHKGVKFRKVTDINEQAAIVVDDVLQSALRLLYGGRRRSSNSSSKHSSSHASSTHHSSNNSSKKSSHVQQHVEHVIEKHIDHRKGGRNRGERRDIRSHSIRPIPYSGQYTDKTTYNTRSLPPPSKKRGSNPAGDMAGMYDMVIQPLGEEKTQKSEAEMEWFRRLKEGTHRPRGEDDSNSTTSIRICHNESSLPEYQERVSTSETHTRQGVNPPTITKGTVTRVFHDLEREGQIPQSVLLAQLQSMNNQQPQSGEYSLDYSTTNTWPLNNRPYPNPAIDAIGLTSAPLSPTTTSSQYNTLPATLNTSTEMYSDHWGYYSDGAYPSGQQSILIGNIPGGYVDDRIYLSPTRGTPPLGGGGGSYTLASVTSAGRPYQDPGRVDLMVDTNQFMRSLPLRLPSYQQVNNMHDSYRVDDITQSLNLPAIEEREEHSGIYSNEPIIVADLMDKTEQPNSGSFYSTDNNARVNMNKNQQLNFYVFNQQGQQPGVPKITYAAQDIQARVGTETQQLTNYFLEEGEMKEMVSQAIQAYQPDPIDLPDHREYTLYHKQTQTRPTPEPKPKKPSSPKRFERKKEKIIKRYKPIREPSPERPKSPVVHRETHHYITKEREIEKLPPAAPPKAEYSVQTDMTGREWEDEMDSLYRALNEAEQRAYEAERAMDEMQSSNAAMESVIHEMHQVVEEEEKKPPREIPVSVAVVKKEPEPKPESESESEEEFYEWTEIEEKEQRLSMAIFEEIEFNLQRSQGGNTSNESGKTSELVPWIVPDKYEAIVDRRRQKVTQIKDIEKEGDKVLYQAGNVPEGLSKPKFALEFDGWDEELEGGGVTEHRDMTLRREQNIKHPKSSSEMNIISIERDGDNHDGDASERHYFSMEHQPRVPASERHYYSMEHRPRAPAGKRNYMSTFDHEMGRAKNAPVRASGRTSYRSDQHIPLALKSLESSGGTGDGNSSRYKTSMSRDYTGTRNPDTGSKFITTIYKDEGNGNNNNNGGNKSKHSVNLIKDVLGISNGPSKLDDSNEHSEKYVTSMTRTPNAKSGSHSTTYITEKSSKPGNNPQNTKHHVTKYTRHIKGGGQHPSNKNISTSEVHIDKLRGFEIPVGRSDERNHYYTETEIELGKPDYKQLSDGTGEKSSRFVSRFDPGNIFFTARSRSGSSDTLLEMAKEPVEGHLSHLNDDHDDSLPDTLPVVEAEHMKRKSFITKSENQQLPPKFHSHVEEDDDGNLVRVTTTEQQMTKTVDYVSEPDEKRNISKPKASDEALVEESFVEVDLTTENIKEIEQEEEEEQEDDTEQSQGQDNIHRIKSMAAYGPEVVSETSVAYKAIEYDDQEKSLGIGTDEHSFPEDKFLYDMKTAMLKPVKIKDKKSGDTLMQYSLGDTMVTEL